MLYGLKVKFAGEKALLVETSSNHRELERVAHCNAFMHLKGYEKAWVSILKEPVTVKKLLKQQCLWG